VPFDGVEDMVKQDIIKAL